MVQSHLVLSNLLSRRFINSKRQGVFFLRGVYGIGFYRSRRLLLMAGASNNYGIRVAKLSPKFYARIQKYAQDKGYFTGWLLKKRRSNLYRIYRKLNLYKGIRYHNGLPVRGQRTKTNRRTAKASRFGRRKEKSVVKKKAKGQVSGSKNPSKDKSKEKGFKNKQLNK